MRLYGFAQHNGMWSAKFEVGSRRASEPGLWDWGMVKQIASAGVVAFVALAACGAVCQDSRRFLPDAPSAQVQNQVQRFSGFVEEERSSLGLGAMSASAEMMRPGGFVLSYGPAFRQKDPEAIFRKYLSPAWQRQGYHALNGGRLMGRAEYAASRTVVVRDASGKGRLNTSYLLRTLTAVAKDTASTPYWRRHAADPFSDYGSMVGNDVGLNLWHEFGPGIEHLMKSHTPAFVSRIEERIEQM